MEPNTDFMAQIEAQRKAHAQKLLARRASLLTQLRALQITELEIVYEGYGDSGNVEDVTLAPSGITLAVDLDRELRNFGWDFAYSLSPGFENNEGGYGELTWNITNDKIDVSHSDRYVETNVTEHEGL